MKRTLIFVLLLLFIGLFLYINNNPIYRINQNGIYISFFNSEVVKWEEDWDAQGDGYIEAVIRISREDYFKLKKKYCQEGYKNGTCIIKKLENKKEVVKIVIKEINNNYYLYYNLFME